MKNRSLILAALLAASFLFSTAVFAQESAARAGQPTAQNSSAEPAPNSEADPNAAFKDSWSVRQLAKITHLSPDHAYWLAVILNFVIVVGAIVWLWKRYVPAVFRNRTASIQKAIEEARQASQDANRRLADIESRLSRLDSEISEMKATSEREAAAEEERIKAAAAEDARHIVESAHQEIEAATKAARRDLTAHAADLAVSLASKQIRVDPPTDEVLVRNFAQQLSTNGSAGKKS
jgi:F-type H+-transporting ATPase subunit b